MRLREAVIASVAVGAESPQAQGTRAPTIATTAATLRTKLTLEHTPPTSPERELMQQWLTTLADSPTTAPATPHRRPQRQ